MNFQRIIKYGVYYYPADKHYYSGSVVQCDRCDRTNLKASIGFQDLDLCLSCAAQVESQVTPTNPPPIRIGPPLNVTHHHQLPSQGHHISINQSEQDAQL